MSKRDSARWGRAAIGKNFHLNICLKYVLGVTGLHNQRQGGYHMWPAGSKY